MHLARKLTIFSAAALSSAAASQVPDLVTALDAGGRAMGAGGALSLTGISTLSTTNNPAALGFVNRSEIGFAARTFPTSNSTVTGPLNDLQTSTKTESGDYKMSHLGFVLPLRGPDGQSSRGALGIAWTTGGWFHDRQRGTNLPNGIALYEDFTRARTDFLNISFGRATGDYRFAWGFGLVFAQQNVRNSQRINFSDTNIPPQLANSDKTGNGLGMQVGAMFTPSASSNITFAATARTPIRIRNNAAALSLYDRIPGRLAFGAAARRDGFRGGRDYLLIAAEVQHFFDGNDSPRIDRQEQTTAHFGAEYNLAYGGAVVPIRVGYAIVPSGGDGFRSRNSLTYGIGYRPNGGDWTIEINFGNPQNGGKETGVFLSYRFGN